MKVKLKVSSIGALWVETVWNWRIHFIEQTFFPPEPLSERASERMSTVERASEASSADQANEWAARANEQVEERMAQYSTRWFHSHSTHWCIAGRLILTKSPESKAHNLRIWDLASMKMFIIVNTSEGSRKSGLFDPFFIQVSNNLKTLKGAKEKKKMDNKEGCSKGFLNNPLVNSKYCLWLWTCRLSSDSSVPPYFIA